MSFINRTGRMSRPRVITIAAVAGLAVFALAACSAEPGPEPTDTETPEQTDTETPEPTDTEAAIPDHEGQVVFAGFGSGFQEVLERDIIPSFEAEYGIDVTYVPGTAATGLAQIQATAGAPTVDVYWASQVTHQQGVDLDLFDSLDPAIVTQLDTVFADARLADDVGVVMGRYAVGLEYNVTAYEENGLEPPTSWNDLWDPALAGHVSLYSFDIGYTQVALPSLAEALGGDINNMDPLWEALSNVQLSALADTPATLNTLLQQGETWLTFNSNSRVNELNDAGGAEVAFVDPEEGAVAFDNIFELVKDAQHPVAAQLFINYALEELAQVAVAEGLSMAPVIPDLEVTDLIERTGYNPDEASRVPVVVPDIPAILSNLEAWSTEWQNALR